ncbi:MAG TPA: pitrilysin family protein, partial [Dongiaceae bacterium]|nr:pitrilysin family protein [Dongiaceae bacterium]
ERIRQSGPTAYEVQLAKNRIESQLVLGLEPVLGQAQALAQAEARYGYRALASRLEEMKALTPAMIRDAARKYLTLENLTLYHYRPKGTPDLGEADALKSVRAALAAPAAQPADEPIPAAGAQVAGAAATAAAAPQTTTLSNGATLVVRERPGAPVVSIGVYFAGGAPGENSGNAGITRLMTRTMQRGTKTRSAEEIDRAIEFLGTEIGTDFDSDSFGLRLDILRANVRPGMELLADVVLNPTFPKEGLEEQRAQQIASIRRAADSSTQRPLQLAFRDLWGTHPYALPQDGFIESVQALDAAALRAWWERTVRADTAVVFMVGDIATADAKALAESALRGLPKRPVAATPLAPVPLLQARVDTVEYRDRKQSAIVLLYPTVPASNPDWPKLRLIGNVTSGLAGTFFAELRGKRSLAYTVFAADASRKEAGAFLAYLATEAAKESDATAGLIGEMKRLGTDGITQDDLVRAKQFFAGSTRIQLQTNGALLEDYAGNQMNGRGLDFTEKLLKTTDAIGLDDLRTTAAKYFGGGNFVVAVLRGKTG